MDRRGILIRFKEFIFISSVHFSKDLGKGGKVMIVKHVA